MQKKLGASLWGTAAQPAHALYHRERAIAERRAARRATDVRAEAAHLELARQHDFAQAIAWHQADRKHQVARRPQQHGAATDLSLQLPARAEDQARTQKGDTH